MTINREPVGKLSFRVLVGGDSGADPGAELIELIISEENLGLALSATAAAMGQMRAFPCHVGFRHVGAAPGAGAAA